MKHIEIYNLLKGQADKLSDFIDNKVQLFSETESHTVSQDLMNWVMLDCCNIIDGLAMLFVQEKDICFLCLKRNLLNTEKALRRYLFLEKKIDDDAIKILLDASDLCSIISFQITPIDKDCVHEKNSAYNILNAAKLN